MNGIALRPFVASDLWCSGTCHSSSRPLRGYLTVTNNNTQTQPVDAYSGNYPEARQFALRRSGGDCQFCGYNKAEETHHWALFYPPGDKVKGDDLVALCKSCHYIATCLRTFYREGTDRKQLDAALEAAYDDRKRWQSLLEWIRTAISASDKHKDSAQSVSVQTVMQIAELQFEHKAIAVRAEIKREIQDEIDDLERVVKRRLRRIVWLVYMLALSAILWLSSPRLLDFYPLW